MTETLHRRRQWPRVVKFLGWGLLVWAGVAYVVMPLVWRTYVHQHPALDSLPGITTTANGIPGDPLNVALIGSQAELVQALVAAGWQPADPLSLKSSLEIAEATVLHRTYARAPVSSLYLWGRQEDLALEQPVGADPRQRHHVRFWRSDRVDAAGRPLWAGAVTYDRSVGLSHTTGQITHHIAAEIDPERDRLFDQLRNCGWVRQTEWVDNFHPQRTGRNGGGDPWTTDGRLAVGQLSPPAVAP